GALAMCDDALATARQQGYWRDVGRLLTVRAEIHLATGEVKEAAAQAEEALELFRQTGDRPDTATAELLLGQCAVADGRPGDAAAHVVAASAALEAVGGQLTGDQTALAQSIQRALSAS